MSIANEHADKFYFPHFQVKDSVNATYIIAFWDQTPCSMSMNSDKLFIVYHHFAAARRQLQKCFG